MTSVPAHTSDSVWDNNAQRAIWYGNLVIERPDGETDYVYAYSSVTEYAPDVDAILPEDCKILERELYLTGTGKFRMWLRGGRWFFEEQQGPDAVDYDTYDAEQIV